MNFIVYTKPACPHCDIAKRLLTEKGHTFTAIELDVGQATTNQLISRDDLLKRIPGARTMPQVVQVQEDGSEYVVGSLKELQQLLG
jgi:glutaredoxin